MFRRWLCEKVALFQTIIPPKCTSLAQHLTVYHHLTFIDNLFPTTTAFRPRILVADDLLCWGPQFHPLKIEQLFIWHHLVTLELSKISAFLSWCINKSPCPDVQLRYQPKTGA